MITIWFGCFSDKQQFAVSHTDWRGSTSRSAGRSLFVCYWCKCCAHDPVSAVL